MYLKRLPRLGVQRYSPTGRSNVPHRPRPEHLMYRFESSCTALGEAPTKKS